jgi:hypothetical protein
VSTHQNTGRVAVITGASSGLGEATGRAMVADGHRIALLARRADRIHALADELGNGAIAIQADVTDRTRSPPPPYKCRTALAPVGIRKTPGFGTPNPAKGAEAGEGRKSARRRACDRRAEGRPSRPRPLSSSGSIPARPVRSGC